MTAIQLYPTRCAICGTADEATLLYPANFELSDFNPMVFSARRLPDRIHYRMVRCNQCGLVRSDPVADPETLAHLYAQSHFDYGEEVSNLRLTYGRYLEKMLHRGAGRASLLEVGCGNGFFLEEALDHGFSTVRGVEPGAPSVADANPRVKDGIVCDIMRPGLFGPEEFDVVCLFQVFDHLPDPGAVLEECWRTLKPGGYLLCLNHNVDAVPARLLGERSPIVDIEHTYLYSPTTMRRILEKYGFRVQETGPVFNTYSLRYLTQLLPLPGRIKAWLLARAPREFRLTAPLGNLYAIGQKPQSEEPYHGDVPHDTLSGGA